MKKLRLILAGVLALSITSCIIWFSPAESVTKTMVDTDSGQTLTNKTYASPVFSGTATGSLTGLSITTPTLASPTFSGTASGSLTNLSLTTPTLATPTFSGTASGSLTNLALTTPTITTPTFTGTASGSLTNLSLITPTLTTPTVTGLLTSGGQISFPASQASSAGVNTLDDYEEGSWTPSLGGTTTYTSQSGTYTKIGRQVTVLCSLVINTIGSGSTTVISGLPFTNGSTIATGAGYFSSSVTNITTLVPTLAGGGASTITLYSLTAAGASLATNAVFQNGTTVAFTLVYLADT